MSLVKNQEIQLNIEGYTAEGSGVGHYDGMAVFVAGAAAGDTVLAHIIKTKKTYAVAVVKDIIEPSGDRIPVDCPQFRSCGGCAYRHISYEAEKELKKDRVKDAFLRIAHMNIPVEEIITGNAERYRNKAQYPVGVNSKGEISIGFYANKSHRIINSPDCILQPSEFAHIVETVKIWMTEYGVLPYNGETGKGLVRHIYIRKAFKTGQIMVCLVINGSEIPYEDKLCEAASKISGVKSFVINENRDKTNVILGKGCKTLWGEDYIEDILCGVRVRLSPLSFYQVNHDMAEKLYQKAAEFAGLKGTETVLDLYCGTGTIGLSMAKKARNIYGAEIVPQAIENAKENARLNNIENAEFFCGDAADAAKRFRDTGIKPDVVLLDPPRKGCDEAVLSTVAEMNPEKIVYVSCDCATLARDVQRLSALGYTPTRLAAADLFPRTAHVESVVLLSRAEK